MGGNELLQIYNSFFGLNCGFVFYDERMTVLTPCPSPKERGAPGKLHLAV
jgi:hypothetical protein